MMTVNETLVTVSGSANLAFVGLTFAFSRGHGASLYRTNNVAFVNCTFTDLGQSAVQALQCNDTLVSNCTAVRMGCGGFRFQEGGARTPTAIVPSGNVVVDSNVTRFQRLVLTYQEAVMLDTGGVAAHNDLSSASHRAITLDGNDVLVVGNVIHDVLRLGFDMGAIDWFPTDWT